MAGVRPQAASTAVHTQRGRAAACPGVVGPGPVRSSLMATARTRGPNPTTTDISMMSSAGREVTMRWTTGCCPAVSIGPSLRMCERARSVVHGLI